MPASAYQSLESRSRRQRQDVLEYARRTPALFSEPALARMDS
jgi:hypothetical protein